MKTNTFVDFFCFVDLFLLLLFLLLLLCLLLPGSVVLLFPFLRFRKRPAPPPPPPPPKMLPPIPPSCSSTTTRTRGRRWFLPRRSRTPAMAFRMPWRWSPPPPPPPRRWWSPPFEWKSTTTFCSAPPPPKECFETMRLLVSPMDVHVSRALCVVIKNTDTNEMSFRFPTTSSKTCKKKTRWMRRPRAREKKKHLLRSPVALSLSLSLVALPFAFSGVGVGARGRTTRLRAVRRLFF